jgi:HEAT repeat protein
MGLAAAALAGAAMAGGSAEAATADELLQKISTYTYGQSREALTLGEDWVRVNLNSPENSRAIAHAFAGLLRGNATKDAMLYVCRQLAVIGTEENVPAIAPLLMKADTADMARYALQRMSGAKVDAVLLEALDKTEADAVPGVINSLGERRTVAAVKPIAARVTEANPKVAESAIAALGKIGGSPGEKALASAKNKVEPVLKRAVSDAQLIVAEQAVADGENEMARRIYSSLTRPDEEAPVRKAAEIGLAASGK